MHEAQEMIFPDQKNPEPMRYLGMRYSQGSGFLLGAMDELPPCSLENQ